MAEARTSKRSVRGGSAKASRTSRKASSKSKRPAREPVCPVAFCPVGMALTTVNQASPDVLEHLLAAAREFLLAARAAIDARAGDFQPRASSGLQRIEIG